MSQIYYILLGLLQGLTEFLPVSSSGHLALFQDFFSTAQKENLLIEIVAHLGSLFAIAFYYRKIFIQNVFKFLKPQNSNSTKNSLSKIFILFISTLPAGLIGLFFKDTITTFFSSIKAVAFGFLFTSFVLLFTYFWNKKNVNSTTDRDWPSPLQALFIGFAQALALFPGVSRSGSTIAAGVGSGLKPDVSAFFSFCSVAPLILAATALAVLDLFSLPALPAEASISNLFLLLTSSFLFGWIGLTLVIKFLEKGKFHYFSYYLFPLATGLLLWG